MNLSRRSEYALLAVIDLALQAQDDRTQLREIASRQDIPEKYLEQLLRPLKTAGLILATRGSRGGYQLAVEPDQITVLAVIEAVEGSLAEDPNEGRPRNVVRDLWAELTEEVRASLGQVTIAALAEQHQQRRWSGDNWVI